MSSIKVSFSSNYFLVNNSFIDRFIKDANPSYIKVYLYLLRHINAGHEISFGKMSSDIGLIKSDIISAFKYWADNKVITYNDDPENIIIDILDISSDAFMDKPSSKSDNHELPPKNMYRPDTTASSSYKANAVAKAINEDENIAHLFSIIRQMLNKPLSPNDCRIIYSFIDYLRLPEKVILILFEYCISINKLNMRYIEKIAYSWADAEINTAQKAEEFVRNKAKQQNLEAYYKHKFKISGRDFTDTETAFLMSWINEYKADEETIVAAFEKTVLNTGKVSFKYMDTIIKGDAETKGNKNTGARSKFKNYPQSYEISDNEKSRIEKMMSEYEGGVK